MTIRTINRAILAALPASALAGAAFAGGLSEPVNPAPIAVPAPVVAAPVGNDWSGFYAGGQLGYGSFDGETLDEAVDGATYGVHAGYQYDFGSLVLGAEVDYDATNIEDEAQSTEIDSIARAKLRVGYDAGSFMPYLTGGIAEATVSDGTDAISDTGAFGGLGVDYMFSDNIRVGAEVLQHNFDDFNDGGADFDATTAAARISFQF